MTDHVNPRRVALKILLDVLEEDKLYHMVLRDALKKNEALGKQDRALISKICTGTIEHMITIDYVIDTFAKTKTSKMKPVIRNVLRMSVYQAMYLTQIPESAICNEAVKLTKKFGFTNLSGFVNGTLRTIMREKDKVKYPEETKDRVKAYSIRYSVPEWLIDELLHQYSVDEVKGLLEASFEEKETTIRYNINKTTPENLKRDLEAEGITVNPATYVEGAFKISDYDAISKISCFTRGEFFIQDESSMLVGLAAGLKPSDVVLDVCAAPGGKSMHAATLAKEVFSQDVSQTKVDKIKENIVTYQLNNINVRVWDATKFDESLVDKFDVVIADVPCSGLGVFGRKPDIKYKVTKQQLDDLVKIQRKILDTIYQYVKPGGILIYSTCTINQAENIENVLWFTEQYPFRLDSLEGYLPEVLKKDSIQEGYVQLVPGIDRSDGFFLARLKRD